ncbi:MAG: family 10 glycosylhydrolase [Ferruginibacter sp.]
MKLFLKLRIPITRLHTAGGLYQFSFFYGPLRMLSSFTSNRSHKSIVSGKEGIWRSAHWPAKKFHWVLVLIIHSFLFLKAGAQSTPEFRGVWVATVDNIDWPVKGNFNSDSQKTAFIQLLDMHRRNGLNALIVQIRPCTDAFYPSQYEPWSEWLTGVQGQPPKPYYDPLQFMILETHKRGMVFHAWMNPYRSVFNIDNSSVSATHITVLHPEWFLTYGDKRYFDPGNAEARQYVTRVVTDVVRRYDVDAIHFDDYFYPYRIEGKEFPDDSSYLQNGKGMKKDDWRRSNTDSIISMLSRAIKKEKRKCQFGISPFGVWRNQDKDAIDGSRTNGAQTNYDDLYADILLWLKNDWIDYVAPQLYWEFGHRIAPYEVLLDWWSKHVYGKHCYIGMGIYKASSNNAWRDVNQLPRQIIAMRNTPNMRGMIFFSSKTFEKNPNGWNDTLRLNYFKEQVKVPEMDWLK